MCKISEMMSKGVELEMHPARRSIRASVRVFEKVVDSNADDCGGAEDCSSTLSSDGAKEVGADMNELEKAGQEFYSMSWQAFLKENWSDDAAKPDANTTKPPPALKHSRVSSLWMCRTNKNHIEEGAVERFACICKIIFNPGDYVVLLADFVRLNEWMVAFCELWIDGFLYPYACVYSSDSVPNQSMSGYPKKSAQYGGLANRARCHPETFKPRLESHVSDMSSTSKLDYSVITNVIWPSMRLTRAGCRKPLRQFENAFVFWR